MHSKVVTRYGCDFCRKANLSAASISKHEKSCTGNPNRTCGICGRYSDGSLAKLAALFSTADADCGLEAVRMEAEGCPACILSAIRLFNRQQRLVPDSEEAPIYFRFDFKKELEAWWRQKHDDEAEGRGYCPL